MHTYALDMAWRPVLADLGVSTADVLRRAGLPADLLSRENVRLPMDAYHAFWSAIEAEHGGPQFPLRLVEAMRAESFSPPIFAALCSPDLHTAATRIQRYKPLIGPMRLEIDVVQSGPHTGALEMACVWPEDAPVPPASMVVVELLFFVFLARLATRHHVVPLVASMSGPLPGDAAYDAYLGTPITTGPRRGVLFAAADVQRPFLTANPGMWAAFEPSLRTRLSELSAQATMAERVHATLLESLPSGRVSMAQVAKQLAVSTRTLQRRLHAEQTTFGAVLRDTREKLARHYLERTKLAAAEIAFLLGFEEPNSFYRAFNDWTGQTPDTVRRAALL